MSSEEEYNDADASMALPDSKKRRVQRACDTCRRKKVRCDGSQMPGNRCSHCIAGSFECTYVEAAKKRGPPKGYVESLENRLEKMEKLLQKVCPDADLSRELGGGQIEREIWQKGNAGAPNPAQAINARLSTYSSRPHTPREESTPSDDEDIEALQLSENLKSMSLNRRTPRFFGKSSGAMLVQIAVDRKKELAGVDGFYLRVPRPGTDECLPWERMANDAVEPQYTFPDPDLGMQLVDLYFVHFNPLTPLLHRPSFERKVAQGVHLHDSSFGAVYLLVCAVGSRYSDDPRVFVDDAGVEMFELSSGWKYFEQVQIVRRTLLRSPCLEDLQAYCLCILFLHGTSVPQAAWAVVGIGIRLAQDVGAHRRKAYPEEPCMEGELWKRAFWILVWYDRQLSSSLGRPCAIQEEDFDVDFPVECDDEYWEHPDPQQAFKQPPNKPSKITFFTTLLKLSNILSFAHRTIYSINKSKILLGFVGQQWEQHIVAELDSSLNKWIDDMPDHLRWDPTRNAKSIFFKQSTSLYANYYYVQISIHRPFIPSPRKPSPLSLPSLAICTNAARSCSHVVDTYRRRTNDLASFLQLHAFTAGIVLLLNSWGGKRSGVSMDPSKEMADVHKCMGVLKSSESRWHLSGVLRTILFQLASAGELPLPQSSPPQGTKRERDFDSPEIPSSPSSTQSRDSPRLLAGSHRIARKTSSRSRQSRQPPPQPSERCDLPLYTNDLGRLPVNFPMNDPALSTAPGPSHPPEMWYPSLPSGAPQHANPQAAPITGHDYGHGHAYSTENLYLDQISNPYGNLGPQQMHTSDRYSSSGFTDASLTGSMGPPMMMMQVGGMLGGDPDMLAMWTSMPTSFGLDDWEAYISGMVNQNGPRP